MGSTGAYVPHTFAVALAQSSLVVFGLTAAKVLLYDLSSAPSIVRIVSLVVLGISFYVAGLLYQRTIGATWERWT